MIGLFELLGALCRCKYSKLKFFSRFGDCRPTNVSFQNNWKRFTAPSFSSSLYLVCLVSIFFYQRKTILKMVPTRWLEGKLAQSGNPNSPDHSRTTVHCSAGVYFWVNGWWSPGLTCTVWNHCGYHSYNTAAAGGRRKLVSSLPPITSDTLVLLVLLECMVLQQACHQFLQFFKTV